MEILYPPHRARAGFGRLLIGACDSERERERERQPPSAASRPLLSISETKLGTEWNDTNVAITRL